MRNMDLSLNDGIYYIPFTAVNKYIHKKTHDMVAFKDIPDGHQSEYRMNMAASQATYDEWLKTFQQAMRKRFKSLIDISVYTRKDERTVLTNRLFHVVIEGTKLGYFAVELISIPGYKRKQLQRRNFKPFLKGIAEILFNQFGAIYLRSSNWAFDEITPDEKQELFNRIDQCDFKPDRAFKEITVRYNKPPVNLSTTNVQTTGEAIAV